MQIDLTPLDIETLLESLKYSERNVRDAAGTPFAVRQEDLQRLASVTDKLRAARKPSSRGNKRGHGSSVVVKKFGPPLSSLLAPSTRESAIDAAEP